uniref:PDZ domain-containing protein n=1 Tax=Phytophthora ramorum TaxID=164328 RepID=H3GE99_PHYRM
MHQPPLRRSSVSFHHRRRSSSSSSLSVSACSNGSTVSNYPAQASRPGPCWHLGPDQSYEDYEVVFTEDKLGLTLKSEEQMNPLGYRIPVTIVKSTIFSVGQVSHQIREGDVLQSVNGESITNLQFQDVLRILKIAPRPIRLRFRTRYTLRGARRAWSGEDQQETSSRRSSSGSADRLEEDRDDSDSQGAVMSESFGDGDSARSTENSSVITDFTDTELTSGRQSSRLAAFLRKPFRRSDGFDGGRWELRMGIVPASPRAKIALESPSKWRVHAKALSYHLQFSRDWTVKVWKNWSGRPRRSSDSERELVTTIFGLDYSKSYVRMLEGALKSWIAYFLGQYVESHTVNVSAKLWQSSERLKLENLTLKSSVVPSWLPFRLKTGFIGLFEADLPISAIFGNASAKIKFQDVLLVLAPLQQDEDELQDEISVLVEHKMRKLEQDLQDRWNGPQVPEYTVPHESEGYFGTDGWIGRTMTKLIDNLQVDIRNLHIRVEGTWVPSGPMRSPPTSRASTKEKNRTEGVKFAVGITLGALSAVTTPSNWRVGGFDDQKDEDSEEKNHLVFKLINAIDLSAYVDPNALHFIHSRVHPKVLQSTLSRLKEMGSRAAKADWWNAEESVHAHRFLVAPINVALKLTMNTAAQHAQTDDPRYDAVFHLSRIWMTLDEEQLSVLNLIIDSFSRHEKWRLMVAEQVKASERHTASNEATMAELAEDYLLLWNQVMVMKNEGMDALRKSEAWIKVTKIEQLLPYEVVRCADKSPAATKDSVKPGLLLIKVDDRPLRSVFKFKSGLDVELAIDSMPGTKLRSA